MTEPTTPRRMVKALVRGEAPSRPLLAPIIFSLGARLENVAFNDFLRNPTKIANAMRQVRRGLKVDAVTCYWDPLLEAEALGCKVAETTDGGRSLSGVAFSDVDDLRAKVGDLEAVATKGRVPLVVDVLRRLKTMLPGEPALMVRVTGPYTLASQLAGSEQLWPGIVEFTAEIVTKLASTLAEAGADVVLIAEETLPEITTDLCDQWSGLLSTVVNVVRFYDALPVLLLNSPFFSSQSLATVLGRDWGCVVCAAGCEGTKAPGPFAVVLPDFEEGIAQRVTGSLSDRPALVTTLADLSPSVDFKQLATAVDAVAGVLRTAA